MMSKFKTLCAVFLALTVIGGCATSSSIVPGNSILSIDNSRNVLSFADTLDSVLPSVVRIGSVKRNSDGEVALSGIGSGAVINTEKGYIITNAHVIADAAGVLVNLPVAVPYKPVSSGWIRQRILLCCKLMVLISRL